jgi:hypothetical protein
VKTVTEKWLTGNLQDTGIACAEHQHGCHEG